MELKGKLVKVLPAITGQGRNGEWRKQDFVIDIDGASFPQKACFTAWGSDKINVESLVEGSMLNVHFDIESREYQGKWYTNLTAWKVETDGDSQQSSPMPQMEVYDAEETPPVNDDLPF